MIMWSEMEPIDEDQLNELLEGGLALNASTPIAVWLTQGGWN